MRVMCARSSAVRAIEAAATFSARRAGLRMSSASYYPGVEVVLIAGDDPEDARNALRRGDLDLAFSFSSETDEYAEAVAVVDDRAVLSTAPADQRDGPLADHRHPRARRLTRLAARGAANRAVSQRSGFGL
jgi:hypothetical protein